MKECINLSIILVIFMIKYVYLEKEVFYEKQMEKDVGAHVDFSYVNVHADSMWHWGNRS